MQPDEQRRYSECSVLVSGGIKRIAGTTPRLRAGVPIFNGVNIHFDFFTGTTSVMTFAQCIQWMKNAGFTVARITHEGDDTSLGIIAQLAAAFRADGTGLKLYVTLDISTQDINNGNVTFATEALAYAYAYANSQHVLASLGQYSDVIIAFAAGNELSGKDNVRLNPTTQGTADSEFNNAKFPALRGIMGGCQDGIEASSSIPVFSNAYMNAEINLIQMLWDGRQPDGTSGYRRIIPKGFDVHSYQVWGNVFCISATNSGWLPFVNFLLQIHDRFGGLPIYLSEFNSDAGDGDSVMATWVRKLLYELWVNRFGLNIAGYAYYAMIDTSGNVWGCLENNGTLRVTRGQALAQQIRQQPDVDAGTAIAKAFDVFAKYSPSARRYRTNWAFTDVSGTAAAQDGGQVIFMPEIFGSGADCIPSNQGSGLPTYVAADKSISFVNGCKPFLINSPFVTTADDFVITAGYAASGSGNAAGMSIFALSATQAANKYGRIGSIYITPTQIVAEWYADSGTDFRAIYTIPNGTYNTPRVVQVQKKGNIGSLWINGVQVATVDLTTFPAFTPTNGYIAQSFLNDTAQFQGKIWVLDAVKGSLIASEVLSLAQEANTVTPTGVTF